jgi:hypothetical protein
MEPLLQIFLFYLYICNNFLRIFLFLQDLGNLYNINNHGFCCYILVNTCIYILLTPFCKGKICDSEWFFVTQKISKGDVEEQKIGSTFASTEEQSADWCSLETNVDRIPTMCEA